MALNLPFVAPGGPTVPGRGTPLRSRLSALSCPHPTCVRKRQKRRRPVPVVRMSSENPEPDIDEDGDADDVVSRRVFSAGILATGTFALVNAVNLFGGDEFKREFAAPFRKLLPALFPASGELGAERSKLDREFAAYYYGQHAIVADQMHIISRADLEEGERELLAKSRPLFFPADGPGDSLDMYDQMKMYNYKLYARVHTIATRTSPAGRLDFSRALGKVLLAKILSAKSVPYPVAMRRDPRSPVAAAEWMEGLRTVLSELVSMGWITAYSMAEFDSGMLAEEGRGELTITCDDVYTISCAQLIGEEQFEEISPKVSGIILALLGSYGLSCSSEDYYLDRVYRPDAHDYMPSQLVTQINFTV